MIYLIVGASDSCEKWIPLFASDALAAGKVPIHKRLIDLGLLAYAAEQQKAEAVRLFPLLKPYRGKITHGFSQWWGRYARKFVPGEENKTFHSFRHRVTDQFRNQAKPLYAAMQEVLGHDVSDTPVAMARASTCLTVH